MLKMFAITARRIGRQLLIHRRRAVCELFFTAIRKILILDLKVFASLKIIRYCV